MSISYHKFTEVSVNDQVYSFPDTFDTFTVESSVDQDHINEYLQSKLLKQVQLINNYALVAEIDEEFELFVLSVFKEVYSQEETYTMKELRDILYTQILSETEKSDSEQFEPVQDSLQDKISVAVMKDGVYEELYFSQLFFALKQFVYEKESADSYQFVVGQYGNTSDVSEMTVTTPVLKSIQSVDDYNALLIQDGFVPHELATEEFKTIMIVVGDHVVNHPDSYTSFKDLYLAFETYTQTGECIDRKLKQILDDFKPLYSKTLQSIIGQVVRDKEVKTQLE